MFFCGFVKMEAYESVLCVKNEVFVYRIPARTSNRGYRAAEWKLDEPDWTGRLRIVAKGKELSIKLEDKTTGELFAQCPVEEYPGVAVEQVLDSSRYFVLRIKDPSGRSAFIGIGFSDRGDSFDLNVALQDHFKWLKREAESEKNAETLQQSGPKLDLGFKEGQTIKINIKTKRSNPKSGDDDDDDDDDSHVSRPPTQRLNKAGGTGGLLPPPPSSGGKLPAPPKPPAPSAVQTQSAVQKTTTGTDLLLDFGQPSGQSSNSATAQNDVWGDFTSASSGSNTSQPSSWVNFG